MEGNLHTWKYLCQSTQP